MRVGGDETMREGEGEETDFDSCSAPVSVPIVIVREGRAGQRNRWNEDQHFAVDK